MNMMILSFSLVFLSGVFYQEGSSVQPGGLPWYIWLGLFILAVLFLWWRLSRSAAVFDEETAKLDAHEGEHEHGGEHVHDGDVDEEPQVGEIQPDEFTQQVESPDVTAAVQEGVVVEVEAGIVEDAVISSPLVIDDLTKIEGIGPKINQLLHDAGINTFAALAATDTNRLNEIVLEAGLRMANVMSWPAQASLAADGKWDELASYQDRLKGGREVA